jgi:hypothetical protein
MPKWLINGFIGWGAVAALTVIISLATDAPYAFLPTVLYGLFMGLIIGALGGIIGGLKHEGWAWAFSGGIIAALVVGVIFVAYQKLF